MKKLLSILLALTMVMGTLVILPFTASAETADDYLVTHWDFAGETPFADKATNGNTVNNLTATGTVTVEDGVATIKASSYLYAEDAKELMRTDEDDITNNTGDRTLYMVFKPASATSTKVASQQSGFQLNYDGSSFGGATSLQSQGENWWCNGYAYSDATQWVTIAVTYDRDTINKTWAISSYYKIGNGDWKVYNKPSNATTYYTGHERDNTNQSNGLYLGLGNGAKCSVDLLFDDVRIYDAALTADQIKGITVTNPTFDPADHLVTHWDFDESAPTTDKGTASQTANNLTATGTVTYSGGAATISAGSFLYAEDADELMRNEESDIINNTGDKTLYMVFKPVTLPTSDISEYASQQSGFRVRYTHTDGNGTVKEEISGSTSAQSAGQNWWCNGYGYTDTSKWITLAVTYDRYNDANQTLIITSYYRVGDGEWKSYSKVADTKQPGYGGENENQGYGLYLGQGNGKRCTEDLIFNDVRIYDAVLSADTIKAIEVAEPTQPEEAAVEVTGHSLTLAGDIGVNFFLTANTTAISTAKVTIMNGETPVLENATFDDALLDSESGAYKFTANVSAKETADELTLTVTGGDTVLETDTYSVKEYGLYVIENQANYSTEIVNLVKALLTYGGCAQTYFNYNVENAYTDTTALENLSTITKNDAYNASVTGEITGITDVAATLMLETKTEIVVALKIDGISASSLEISGGTAVKQGDYVYITTDGILVQDLDEMQTITIASKSDSTQTIEIQYSPMTFIQEMAGEDGAIDLLVRAMYACWDAAEAYVDSLTAA